MERVGVKPVVRLLGQCKSVNQREAISLVKVMLGRMGEFARARMANFCLKTSPQFAQVELFLSRCSNLFWLARAACGKC